MSHSQSEGLHSADEHLVLILIELIWNFVEFEPQHNKT